MRRATLFLFIVIILSGCAPQMRIKRILKRNPHLLQSTTQTVRDTIITDEMIVRDSMVFDTASNAIDTLHFYHEMVTQRIIIDNERGMVDAQVTVMKDTIYLTKEVPVIDANVLESDGNNLFKSLLIGGLAGILFLGLVWIVLLNIRKWGK